MDNNAPTQPERPLDRRRQQTRAAAHIKLTEESGAMTKLSSGPFKGLQRNGYGVIYPNPPWRFLTYDQVKVTGRGKTKHYGTMPTEEIAALPVATPKKRRAR